VWYSNFKDGSVTLNDDPEKHRDRPRTLYKDENGVIVEGLIREVRRVKVCEIALQKTVVQYFTPLEWYTT
jgi:hypothetical protein